MSLLRQALSKDWTIESRTSSFGTADVRNSFANCRPKRSLSMLPGVLFTRVLPVGALVTSFAFVISVILLT